VSVVVKISGLVSCNQPIAAVRISPTWLSSSFLVVIGRERSWYRLKRVRPVVGAFGECLPVLQPCTAFRDSTTPGGMQLSFLESHSWETIVLKTSSPHRHPHHDISSTKTPI
jgi:hypothetical protein